MDKKSLLAIGIITIIILLLPSYYDLVYDEPVTERITTPPAAILEQEAPEQRAEKNEQVLPAVETKKEEVTSVESMISKSELINEAKDEIIAEIETPLVTTKISNQGGGTIEYWYLNEYDTWMKTPAKIIDPSLTNGLALNFIMNSGEQINLNDYRFEVVGRIPARIQLDAEESFTFHYELKIENTVIKKDITIYGNTYHIDLKLDVVNAKDLLLNDDYEIGWINGLPSNEKNVVEEFTYSETYAWMGGELEDFEIDSEEQMRPVTINGTTEWIATRTKYFLAAVIPDQAKTTGVVFGGEGVKVGDVIERRYNTSLISAVTNNSIEDSYKIYMGPLEYSVLSDYNNNLDDLVMNHGWYEKTFRPISLLLLRVLKFFHLFIPNYGIVIILFSVLIKILVYPLTKKSYKSMKEMSRVQPLLAELKEKYKSDPQRMNKETMKLYKEHGINPMGGCLPMLLQLPLLGALFIIFRSTIQLRGASFIPGWIDDLSSADTIFTLPFSLPMYGDTFNILPILMAVTMIFQSKMTMQDPKQKAMVYLMPVFMLLIFNQFPSGLNLYYTMFNLLTIIQQKFIDTDKKPVLKK
jgi:YidC/Oxa1 family membrane protein insertase